MRDRPVRRRPLVEELEPRILYSADAFAGLLDTDHAGLQAEVRVVAPPPAPPSPSIASTQASSEQVRSHELVFIDRGVEGYQQDRKSVV